MELKDVKTFHHSKNVDTNLGNVIIKDGIKHYPKKVQGIMDLGRPNTTTEARFLINMV